MRVFFFFFSSTRLREITVIFHESACQSIKSIVSQRRSISDFPLSPSIGDRFRSSRPTEGCPQLWCLDNSIASHSSVWLAWPPIFPVLEAKEAHNSSRSPYPAGRWNKAPTSGGSSYTKRIRKPWHGSRPKVSSMGDRLGLQISRGNGVKNIVGWSERRQVNGTWQWS